MKKPFAVILLSALLALPAAAQTLTCFQRPLQDTSGDALAGQTVAVLSGTTVTATTTTEPGSPLATIYIDPYGRVQVPQNGSLSLSGTVTTTAGSPDVAWASGNYLSPYMVGYTITINSQTYTVSAYTDESDIVLTSNALSTGTFSYSITEPQQFLTSDGLGNFSFCAALGYYVMQIYGPRMREQFVQGISLGDASAAGKPQPTDGVMFVSPNGNDSYDGLSWGTAKQTLYAAVEAAESSAVGGGTIYVAANAACGGPVSGQGLWLYRNATSPGTGWLAATYPLNIVGVGATGAPFNGPAPVVSLNCGSSTQHALDLDAINTSLRFENLSFTGSIGANIASSSTVTFENDWFQVNNSSASNGPAVMVGAGSFWLYFRHCVFSSNNNASTPKTGTDASEAFVVDPGSGSQSGLVYIDQSVVNGGGDIKVVPSSGNVEEGIYVNGLSTENQNDGKGAVWITDASAYSTNTVANVTVSDATATTSAVEVDAGVPEATTVWNDAGQTINYTGPMTVLSGYPRNAGNLTENPNESGQVGFIGGNVYGQINAARRGFSPTSSEWTNQISQNPTAWHLQYNGTLTENTSATGPNGTTYAMSIGETGGTYTPNVYFTDSNFTYAAGDYIIVGGWYMSPTGTLQGGYPFNLQVLGSCATAPIYGMTGNSVTGTTPILPGQWKWASAALKVTTGGTCQTNFGGQFNSTSGALMYYFAPVLYHIATGDVTDAEAAEIAANLVPFPDSLGAGVEATLRGQPFAFGGSGDPYFATLDHTTLAANQTYNLPSVGGQLLASVYVGTISGPTAAIASGACSTTITTPVFGATTSSKILATPNADPAAANYKALSVYWFPTAGNVNLEVCNPSASSVTPTALTFNVTVVE